MQGAENLGVAGAPFPQIRSVERRLAERRPLEITFGFQSTPRIPPGPKGTGSIVDLGPDGALIVTDRQLEVGEWIRLAWRPSLRDRRAMPETLQPLEVVGTRVVRKVENAATAPGTGRYAYGVKFARSRGMQALSLFDLALPWIGLLLIALTTANVLWLRADNVYYFWYHPVINLYGILISSYILTRVVLACFYKAPKDAGYLPTVTVGISCKNEHDSIRRTLDCIFASEYPPELLQVIAVDDGSTDGTWEEMELAREAHPSLELIRFETNRGKRYGMAAAAQRASGDVIVFVDSDSFVRSDAVYRIVQGFADPDVGAVCGHGRVENAGTNLLTKMQEVRYYVAFRIVKSAESLFSTVTCCSGCLAAYRRSTMMGFLDAWLGQSFLGRPATFGDDRSLTNFMLRRWRVIYDSGAICSTIVPETLKQFFTQQLRWKKSWIRESLLASLFMWKRHPLAAFYFYLGVIFPIVSPAVVFVALVLPLVGIGAFSYLYIYGTALMALLYGLVYLMRHKTGLWVYGLIFSLFYMVVLVWQTYYALATLRKNHWGTR